MLPLKGRATFVLVSLCVYFVVCAASTWVEVSEMSFYQELQHLVATEQEELIDYARADQIDSMALLVGIAYLVVLVVSLVAFMMWVHRINRSLISAGVQNMTESPAWSVAWYFIPIACVWKPVISMRETWRATEFLASTNRTGYWCDRRVGSLVGWWWAVWLVTSAVNGVYTSMYGRADELDEMIRATRLGVFSYVFDAANMLLTIILVSRLTAMHDRAKAIMEAEAISEKHRDDHTSHPEVSDPVNS